MNLESDKLIIDLVNIESKIKNILISDELVVGTKLYSEILESLNLLSGYINYLVDNR